ncbi:MAG: hypothetical protein ACE5HT_07045 [Gemmatimonadales bacterium]
MKSKRPGKQRLTAEEWDELMRSKENGAEMPEFDLKESEDRAVVSPSRLQQHLAGLWRMLGLGD